MSRTVTKVWTLLPVNETSILVGRRWFWTYVTGTLESAKSVYIRYAVEDGNDEFVGAIKKSGEALEKVE